MYGGQLGVQKTTQGAIHIACLNVETCAHVIRPFGSTISKEQRKGDILMLARKNFYRVSYRIPLTILLFFCVLGTVVACARNGGSDGNSGTASSSTGQPAIPTITFKAMDYSYNQPQTIPAGMVNIVLVNNGNEPHQATFVHLNTGVTFEQFKAALFKGGDLGAEKLGTFLGGPNAILPGKSQEVTLNLPPGQYATVCFVPTKENVPHYMKGMVQSFTATRQSNESKVQPRADGQVLLKDFSYTLPSSIASGPITLQVTNQGAQPHEMTLLQLAPGKRVQDVVTFLQKPAGPPPFAYAGGITTLAPAMSEWLKLNLAPGNYAVVCYVTDPHTHKPHVMLGMISGFSVQ